MAKGGSADNGDRLAATPGMKWMGGLLVITVAVVGLSRAVTAQTETSSRTLLVYVSQTLKHSGLSPGEHVLSFSTPVEIPGARLPAGPYIFRMLGERLVRVESVTRSKVYATFFTIPSYGTGDESRERIKFDLTSEDGLPRIVAWYLPWSTGHEFLYPKPKRKPVERERETEDELGTGWR
jgi:hypothetical protein